MRFLFDLTEHIMTKMDFSQTAAFIWSVADLLRGDFKQSQYGRVILPFTLLRRFECVLEKSKDAVVAQAGKIKSMNLPQEAQEKLILRAADGLSFFNTSPMSLSKLGQTASAIISKTTSRASPRTPAKSSSISNSASLSACLTKPICCSKSYRSLPPPI